jgi:ribosome biogenesis GTPase / thiamine phosphate phosphatase
LDLQQLGWNSHFETHACVARISGSIPGRVAEEHKDFSKIYTANGIFLAEVTGRMRFHATHRGDYPVVGDWVLIRPRVDEERATIEMILPRQNFMLRKGTGKDWNEQFVASNIDTTFVVTSLNQDLNLRRIERYLALAWESGCRPVVVLNKADLCEEPTQFEETVRTIAHEAPVLSISALEGTGMDALSKYMPPGETAIFIGSSGVGKSTILNRLADANVQRVQEVRSWDDRGRHTTTSRQMLLLSNGSIVIDTPGMRLVGMWDHEEGLSKAFEDIEVVAANCRFRDCRHGTEPGCAVIAAVEEGTLEKDRMNSYGKLKAELKYVERKTSLRAQQQEKANAKRISRLMKRHYKQRGI